MSTPTNIQSEVIRHREINNARLQRFVDDQVNVESTHAFLLRFTAADRQDAVGLSTLLFAKGMRLLSPEPRLAERKYVVEVAVKHNLREVTAEDFTCDLITLASGVRATYDDWEILSETPAEESQSHGTPQ